MLPAVKDLLRETGVIAIARGTPREAAVPLAQALCAGGVGLMEVTMNTEGVGEIISMLKERFAGKLRIGAGTVTDQARLKKALSAGAEFVVTPNLNEDVVWECLDKGIPIFPGVLTPTEICRAMVLGCEYVKLFPVGGMPENYLKDVLSALSDAKILAVGGVSSGNFADYLRRGAVGAGVGGNLCRVPEDGDFTKVEEEARRLVEIYRGR